jgi:hypothetical protein
LIVAYAAIGATAIRTGDAVWLQWLFTMNLLLIGIAVIAARVSPARNSAFWTGVAVFDGLYLVSAFSMFAPSYATSPHNLMLVTTLWFREFALDATPRPGAPMGLGPPTTYDDRVNAMHLLAAALVGLVGGLIGLVIARAVLGREAERRHTE